MRIVAAIVEAIVAAAIAGAIEAARALGGSGAGFAIGTWAELAGLATAGAIGAAIVVVVVGAALARIPAIAAWRREVAAGGGARTVAVWRVGLVTVAFVVAAVAIFVVVQRAHDGFRFIEGGPVALLVACVLAPLGLAIALAARALDRRMTPRLAGRALLDGRRIWIAAAVVAVILAGGPALAMRLAAPAVERDAVVVGALLVVAVAGVRLAGLGRRRTAQIAAGVVVAACVVAIARFGDAERARGVAGVHGVFGKLVAERLWSLADGDGDGYASEAGGGADCDDGDPARHPTAIDVAGNGVDENCTGADARPRAFASPPPSLTPSSHDIVLISVDALRADHLGAYGYDRPTSPALDAFAATAVRFDWALTSCPATRCAVPPLFSGRYATVLRETPGEVASLAGSLRDAGYDTAAITCCGRFTFGARELQGFASVDASADGVRLSRPGQSNADAVANAALEWLKRRPPGGKPFMLWLHFYDPHHPYVAPDQPGRFGDRDVDRYDAEIAYTDRHVARVLAALDPARTIVTVTADHGEEFGEHGIRFHARSLFAQVVRVPLLVRYPGAAPRVVATPVSILDVMPTLLELAGAPVPPGLNGRSLATAVRGGDAPARPVLMELVPDTTISRNAAALAHDGWRVIWDRKANAWSLFSLADPADSTDRADTEPAVLAAMKQRLFDAIDNELALTR